MGKPRTLLLLFLAALAMFRLGFIGQVPVTPDEAYYWTWSRDISVCYYDQPGMVAWINRLFGLPWSQPSSFSLRLPAVIFSFLASLVLYFAYRLLYKEDYEAEAFVICVSFLPLSFMSGLFMIHDTMLFFFLILCYFFMFRIVALQKSRDWYFLALAVAGALYSKFSAVMPAACFALYIFISEKNRKWLKRPEPYLAFLIAAALFMPVLIWNHQHDWISLHAVQNLVRNKDLTFLDRISYFLSYMGTQLGAYSPFVWIALVAAMVEAVARIAARRSETELLLVTLSLPIWFYFAFQSFRSHVFGNWSAVGYIPVFILLSRYSSEALRGKAGDSVLLRPSRAFVKWYMAAAVGLAVFISLAITLHARYEIFRPALASVEKRLGLEKRIDYRLDEEFMGWDILAELVDKARPDTDFILARRYQVASIIEFYVPDHPRVLVEGSGRRESQFELRGDLSDRVGQTALFVDIRPLPEDLAEEFERITPVFAPFSLGNLGMTRKEFYIYRCGGLRPN